MEDRDKAGSWNFHHYNSRLRPFAHRIRNNSTGAEIRVWKYLLRARNMRGYQFRRQRPVLNYITDFMCFDLKLVIEIDGSSHDSKAAQAYDKHRDEDLAAIGFTTLRFTNWEVFNQLPFVANRIEQWIDENATVPPPGPRQRGDRRKRKPPEE